MAIEQKTDGVWKSGKGKGRKTPKGRQVTEEALFEIRELWVIVNAVLIC